MVDKDDNLVKPEEITEENARTDDFRHLQIPLDFIADPSCKKNGCYGRGHVGTLGKDRTNWVICECARKNFWYVKRAGRKLELFDLVKKNDKTSIRILIKECKNLAITGKTTG